MTTPNPIFYSLHLESKRIQNPVDTIWEIVQILADLGDNFAPGFLGSNPLHRKPLTIDGPQAVAKMLGDPLIRYGTDEGLGVSFALTPINPMIRIYFAVGRSKPGLNDSFRIDFPSKIPILDLILFDQLNALFKKCVLVFNPFWGCIENEANIDEFQGTLNPSKKYTTTELETDFSIVKVDATKVPRLIHWFNYFDPTFVERLGGRNKLLAGPVWHAEILEELGGIIWILQQEPFDNNNSKHLACQRDAINYLRLFDIHKQYMLN